MSKSTSKNSLSSQTTFLKQEPIATYYYVILFDLCSDECWKNFREGQAIARQEQGMSECEKICQHGCL